MNVPTDETSGLSLFRTSSVTFSTPSLQSISGIDPSAILPDRGYHHRTHHSQQLQERLFSSALPRPKEHRCVTKITEQLAIAEKILDMDHNPELFSTRSSYQVLRGNLPARLLYGADQPAIFAGFSEVAAVQELSLTLAM